MFNQIPFLTCVYLIIPDAKLSGLIVPDGLNNLRFRVHHARLALAASIIAVACDLVAYLDVMLEAAS